jgi:hypothetical protein
MEKSNRLFMFGTLTLQNPPEKLKMILILQIVSLRIFKPEVRNCINVHLEILGYGKSDITNLVL